MRADDDLRAVDVSNMISRAQISHILQGLTFSLLPGSFTVANCSSLYFSNAGPRLETTCGVDAVRALISVGSKLDVPVLEVRGTHTGQDVIELRLVSTGAHSGAGEPDGWGRHTSPGGAPSTKEEIVSICSMGQVRSGLRVFALLVLNKAD